jgi:hypothetical protein
LAIVPVSVVAYTIAASSDAPFLTSLIQAYQTREAELARRNILNQTAVEQAAMDRHLFVTRSQDVSGPDLVYPECVYVPQPLFTQINPEYRMFNSGSPWNVAAGQGGADLSHLIEHYGAREKATEEGRIARLKDGKVTTVYDDTTGGRLPSFGGKKDK